jgi:hypothetical protein
MKSEQPASVFPAAYWTDLQTFDANFSVWAVLDMEGSPIIFGSQEFCKSYVESAIPTRNARAVSS